LFPFCKLLLVNLLIVNLYGKTAKINPCGVNGVNHL
jgi:hypothetical protein